MPPLHSSELIERNAVSVSMANRIVELIDVTSAPHEIITHDEIPEPTSRYVYRTEGSIVKGSIIEHNGVKYRVEETNEGQEKQIPLLEVRAVRITD
jgi:hypothetical protein